MLDKRCSPRPEQWRINLSRALKGRNVWNKGKKGLQKAWNKIEVPKDWLYQKYVLENKSVRQIAAESEFSGSVILRALREYDIPRKNARMWLSGKTRKQVYGDKAEAIKNKIVQKLKGRKITWGDKISTNLKESLKEKYKNGIPPDIKLRLKIQTKNLWQNPEYRLRLIEAHKGQNPWNKGKTGVYSEETRRKLSLSRLGKKVFFSEAHKKKLSEAAKRRFLEHREFLKQLARPHLTLVEKKVKYFLQQYFVEGQDFFYDECDKLGGTLYRPDFQFPFHKVILEVDGFYTHFTDKGRQRDEKRDSELQKFGWNIYRFPQKDILNNFEGVKANILKALNGQNEQHILT